jgi:hypothetical protein
MNQRIRVFSMALPATLFVLMNPQVVSPAYAQSPWSALPGSCGSTDNNFHSGPITADYPTARFRTPGGAFAFAGLHYGYIAVTCSVDNPRDNGPTKWSQLQVTYRDPDGQLRIDDPLGHTTGNNFQVYVNLGRVSRTTGQWQQIASFDSNNQCPDAGAPCGINDDIHVATVDFTHTFDFENYAYAVYGRLYRVMPNQSNSSSPAIYQLRIQPAAIIGPPPPQ